MDEVQSSIEKLNDSLRDITGEYLDTVDSVYSFWFVEVDSPEESDIKGKIENPEIFISEIIEMTINWGSGLSKRFHNGIPSLTMNTIMDTLNHHGAELFDYLI